MARARRGKTQVPGPTRARRERMAQALRLREDGASYRAIAARLEVSERQAWLDVTDALKEITREPAEEVLTLELARLDNLYLIAYAKARTEQEPAAINSALRVMERRARLLGLDQLQTGDATQAVRTLLDELLEGTPQDDDSE